MKKIKKYLSMMMLLGVAFFITGCGEKALSVDTTKFEKSISKYLSSKSMDMKVFKFKDIKVEGNSANATCSMKHKSGMGPSVQWGFVFTKSDNEWNVTKCKQ